jgi:hypothetical protein
VPSRLSRSFSPGKAHTRSSRRSLSRCLTRSRSSPCEPETKLEYEKLAARLGVDRDPITLAAPSRVADLLDVDPGFETVLTDAEVARFVDERVLRLSKALVGSGRNDRCMSLPPPI